MALPLRARGHERRARATVSFMCRTLWTRARRVSFLGCGMLLALLSLGCEASVDLALDLRTDHVAPDEFDTVVVLLDGVEQRRVPADGRAFLAPVRVAEFGGLPSGRHRVELVLLSAGRRIASRALVVQLDGDRIALVVIARICEGRVCPQAGDPFDATECRGQSCVRPDCDPADPSTCPEPDYREDADCPSGAPCARGRCEAGSCLVAADDSVCGAGERCHPVRGCEPIPSGPRDAGERDAPEAPDTGDAFDAGGDAPEAPDTGDALDAGGDAPDTSTDAPLGPCAGRSAGTVCRPALGPCDIAETCDGAAAACPEDGLVPGGTECRASMGACDAAEQCTGSSAECPSDGFAPSGTECRAAAGVCDVAERCTGSSADCPGNGFAAAGATCRSAAGTCDVAESCTGSSASCPANGFRSSSTVCRATAGSCDLAENCTGSSASCPTNRFRSSSTVCRTSAGVCDVAESCTGSSASCPVDAFRTSGTCTWSYSGMSCPGTCDGSGAACAPGCCRAGCPF